MQVLHLEDEVDLRRIVRIGLSIVMPQIVLHQFGDSDNALSFIRLTGGALNLLVLDIRVPGKLDGLQLAKEVREMGYDTPIIIMSAYRRPSKWELDELDARWMDKPVDFQLLHLMILQLGKRQT